MLAELKWSEYGSCYLTMMIIGFITLKRSLVPLLWGLVAEIQLRSRSQYCSAVCCSVLYCVAVCCGIWLLDPWFQDCGAVRCSALQCVAVYFGICSLKSSRIWDLSIAVQCVAMFCSVLQCVAVCCTVWWLKHRVMTETSWMTRYSDAAYAIPNVLSENDRCHRISGSYHTCERVRGGGLGSSTIFKKFHETYAPS